MMPHDPRARTGASLSVQGSLVFEIFQTQADGAVHACASSATAAQVSALVSTHGSCSRSFAVAESTLPQTG